jgi:two-component system sensor histidine kinase KdpD
VLIIFVFVLSIGLITLLTTNRIIALLAAMFSVFFFNTLVYYSEYGSFLLEFRYSLSMVFMQIIAVIISGIASICWYQLQHRKYERYQISVLLEINRHLKNAQNEDEILQLTTEQLSRLNGKTTLICMVTDNGRLGPVRFSAGEADHCVIRTRERMMIERKLIQKSPLPINSNDSDFSLHVGPFHCFMLNLNDEDYAVVLLRTGNRQKSPGNTDLLIQSMLDQVKLAILTERLRQAHHLTLQESQKEKTHANLMRIISHDIRLPLTSIMGVANFLLTDFDRIDPRNKSSCIKNIYNDAEWMYNLAENLLLIDQSHYSINRVPEILQDIIYAAVKRLDKKLIERSIRLEMPERTIIVSVEAQLFMQLVTNILENAIKYSPLDEEISISVSYSEDLAIVEITDNGNGIQNSDKEKVFDLFYTAHSSANLHELRRGVGLGLAICRSIIEVHGGRIYIRDHQPRGTTIGFSLAAEVIGNES